MRILFGVKSQEINTKVFNGIDFYHICDQKLMSFMEDITKSKNIKISKKLRPIVFSSNFN